MVKQNKGFGIQRLSSFYLVYILTGIQITDGASLVKVVSVYC